MSDSINIEPERFYQKKSEILEKQVSNLFNELSAQVAVVEVLQEENKRLKTALIAKEKEEEKS